MGKKKSQNKSSKRLASPLITGTVGAQAIADALPGTVAASSRVAAAKAYRASLARNNPLRPTGFLGKVFDFLASLELAVTLILVVGTVCVAGTIYESNFTARLAQRLVYRTPWFDFLLTMIFINVVFATLSRFPWRIAQIGWLITHLGVLTVLTGSLVSYRMGVEGNLMLNEGQSGDRISLPTSFFAFQEEGGEARYKFDSVEVEWGKPQEKAQTYRIQELGLQVEVDDFYPHSEWVEEWTGDGAVRNPALHFTIESAFAGSMGGSWLAPRMAGHRRFDMGPATFVAQEVLSEEALQSTLSPPPKSEEDHPKGWLEVTFNESGEIHKVDVERALEETLPVGNTGYAVRATSYFEHAYLDEENRLVDVPGKPSNPAVIYNVLKGEEVVAESQKRFARIPEFESMHGAIEELPFKVVHKKDEVPSGNAEFAILVGPGDDLYWKVTTTSGAVTSGTLEVGQPVPMTMMTAGMSLLVDEFHPNASRKESLRRKPIKRGDFRSKAAHLAIRDKDGQEADVWSEYGTRQRVQLGDKVYQVSYLPNEVPLGFSIELLDFRLLHYPGAMNRPMSYESDVKVHETTDSGSLQKSVEIKMNEPMDHGGYRVFQSSYIDKPEGDPQISIFSIAHDPGVPVIYIGSIILCCGIALMFWGKPFFRRLEKRLLNKKQEVTAS